MGVPFKGTRLQVMVDAWIEVNGWLLISSLSYKTKG
jgi:hypothetical protein